MFIKLTSSLALCALRHTLMLLSLPFRQEAGFPKVFSLIISEKVLHEAKYKWRKKMEKFKVAHILLAFFSNSYKKQDRISKEKRWELKKKKEATLGGAENFLNLDYSDLKHGCRRNSMRSRMSVTVVEACLFRYAVCMNCFVILNPDLRKIFVLSLQLLSLSSQREVNTLQ